MYRSVALAGLANVEALMRTVARVNGLGLLAVAFLASAVACAGEGNKVEIRSVKLADLEKTVKDLKGKVVVVDFWAFD
jgi:hypothetical protein